jgi:hypothetical protein
VATLSRGIARLQPIKIAALARSIEDNVMEAASGAGW